MARAGLDFDELALEESTDPPRQAAAAAQDNGVVAEIGLDLRDQLLDRSAR